VKTREEITKEFTEKLQALLNEYGANIEARDHWIGYAECGEDVRMTVEIPAFYNEEHDCVREWTEIDLGCHLAPNAKLNGA
jgi:hypothetical protein